MTFESIEAIALARKACPRPATIVAAVLHKDEAAKKELISHALISSLASLALHNDPRPARDVISSLDCGKQSKAVKSIVASFTAAVRDASGIINKSGKIDDIVETYTFIETFNYITGVLSEQIRQALSPKPKASKSQKEDKAGEVSTPPAPTADEVKAAVAIHNFKEAQHEIESLKRQVEALKAKNFNLKTRVNRLRALATGYKVKSQAVADKPTRAAKSRVKTA
jgi:hypothetical protein